MASQTTARRGVLNDLNVNTYSGRVTCTDSKPNAGSAEKSQIVAQVSLQTFCERGEISGSVREDVEMGGVKRDLEFVEDSQRSPKRFKTGSCSESRLQLNSRLSDLAQALLPDKLCDGDKLSLSPQSPRDPDVEAISSPSLSPTPSLESNEGALNETQNTLITEPDDARLVWPTNHDGLRQKARAIKLRLRLASYKVRTNQIDLPISRLQVKTTLLQLPTLPRVTVKANNSHRRTPLPSVAVSNIPNIRVHESSSERQGARTNIHSSPPPPNSSTALPPRERVSLVSPRKHAGDSNYDSFATPLMSRQRQGLLNPPNLRSPIWDETRSPGADLTSSVVKGRAADGLLSLMRQGT